MRSNRHVVVTNPSRDGSGHSGYEQAAQACQTEPTPKDEDPRLSARGDTTGSMAAGHQPNGGSTKDVLIGWTNPRLLRRDLVPIRPLFWAVGNDSENLRKIRGCGNYSCS